MWQDECGAHAIPLTQALWLFNLATGVHGTLTSNIITWIYHKKKEKIYMYNCTSHAYLMSSVLTVKINTTCTCISFGSICSLVYILLFQTHQYHVHVLPWPKTNENTVKFKKGWNWNTSDSKNLDFMAMNTTFFTSWEHASFPHST